jgi:hypothetical protein
MEEMGKYLFLSGVQESSSAFLERIVNKPDDTAVAEIEIFHDMVSSLYRSLQLMYLTNT